MLLRRNRKLLWNVVMRTCNSSYIKVFINNMKMAAEYTYGGLGAHVQWSLIPRTPVDKETSSY